MKKKPIKKKSKQGFDKDRIITIYKGWEITSYKFIPNHFSVYNQKSGKELWDAGFVTEDDAKKAIDNVEDN